MSVKAVKAGAVDFIEKPFDDQTLLDAINEAIKRDRKSKLDQAEINEIQKRVDSLTKREKEVFALVVRGLLNRKIAFELGTSEKTVKVHRGRVMEKMQAESLADLVRMAERIRALVIFFCILRQNFLHELLKRIHTIGIMEWWNNGLV